MSNQVKLNNKPSPPQKDETRFFSFNFYKMKRSRHLELVFHAYGLNRSFELKKIFPIDHEFFGIPSF